jgi:hypothetical protein
MQFILLSSLSPLHTLTQNLLNLYSIHHVTTFMCSQGLPCILSRCIRIVQIYFSTLSFHASVTHKYYTYVPYRIMWLIIMSFS